MLNNNNFNKFSNIYKKESSIKGNKNNFLSRDLIFNNKFNNSNKDNFNNIQKGKINKFNDYENYHNNMNMINEDIIKEEINDINNLKYSSNKLSRSFDNISESKILLNDKPNNKRYDNKYDLYDFNNNNLSVITRQPKGLENIGATCYMNATLQCFYHCANLTKYIISKKYIKDRVNVRNNTVTYEYIELVNQLYNYDGKKYIAPYRFKDILGRENPLFKGIAANDSKDLILFLQQVLAKELALPDKNEINEEKLAYLPYDQTNEDNVLSLFIKDFKKERSIIKDLFYFFSETQSQCMNCGNKIFNFQVSNFLIFPLEKTYNDSIRTNISNNINYMNNNMNNKYMTPILVNSLPNMNLNNQLMMPMMMNNMNYMNTNQMMMSNNTNQMVDYYMKRLMNSNNMMMNTNINQSNRSNSQRNLYNNYHNNYNNNYNNFNNNFFNNFNFSNNNNNYKNNNYNILPIINNNLNNQNLLLDDGKSYDKISKKKNKIHIKKNKSSKNEKFYVFNKNFLNNNNFYQKNSYNQRLLLGSGPNGHSLSLYTKSKPKVTLDQCFESYLKPELLSGDNKHHCNKCHNLADAYYTTQIYSSSNILIIILNYGKGILFECDVDFDEYINISKYVKQQESPVKYRLLGIIVHIGPSSMGGHFIAYCRGIENKENWYKLNDAMVTKATFQEIKSVGIPYVLFYENTLPY